MDIIITIIITSVVWCIVIFFVRRIERMKNVAKALNLPNDFYDTEFYEDKALQIKVHLCKTSECSNLYWKDMLPDYTYPYWNRCNSHGGLDLFIKTVKLFGRDLAILNKNGDIEVKV